MYSFRRNTNLWVWCSIFLTLCHSKSFSLPLFSPETYFMKTLVSYMWARHLDHFCICFTNRHNLYLVSPRNYFGRGYQLSIFCQTWTSFAQFHKAAAFFQILTILGGINFSWNNNLSSNSNGKKEILQQNIKLQLSVMTVMIYYLSCGSAPKPQLWIWTLLC